MQDHELIWQFTEHASQEAFRQLVGRHLDAVYTAARRQVRDPQLAEDVAQAVFIVLARKARRLRGGDGSLAGWLMKTTYFASRDALRKEACRRRHEQAAATARAQTMTGPDEVAAACRELEPRLDRAMARLRDDDRGAVTLRYLHGKSLAEVGESLGISPHAAAKRIARALERLRRSLQPAGATVIPLTALLEHLPRHRAPAALPEFAADAAVTAAAESSAATVISEGVLHTMLWSKAKAASLLLGVTFAAAMVSVGTLSMVLAQQRPDGIGSARTSREAPGPADLLSFTAKLDSGVSFELIGVCEHPSQGRHWWRADGSPLPKAPYDRKSAAVRPGPDGNIARELAVRIHTPINEDASDRSRMNWLITAPGARGAVRMSGKRPSGAANQPVPGVEAVIVAIPDAPQGAVFRVNVASARWKTLAVAPAAPGAVRWEAVAGALEVESVLSEDAGLTRLSFVRPPHAVPSHPERVMAIDADGIEFQMNLIRRAETPDRESGDMTVRLPLASIKQLRYEERPDDQWIEIRNISLHPGKLTQVQVVTSDDAADPATRPAL